VYGEEVGGRLGWEWEKGRGEGSRDQSTLHKYMKTV
jgi:hypothetical protein